VRSNPVGRFAQQAFQEPSLFSLHSLQNHPRYMSITPGNPGDVDAKEQMRFRKILRSQDNPSKPDSSDDISRYLQRSDVQDKHLKIRRSDLFQKELLRLKKITYEMRNAVESFSKKGQIMDPASACELIQWVGFDPLGQGLDAPAILKIFQPVLKDSRFSQNSDLQFKLMESVLSLVEKMRRNYVTFGNILESDVLPFIILEFHELSRELMRGVIEQTNLLWQGSPQKILPFRSA
jgi:hypothetical protein